MRRDQGCSPDASMCLTSNGSMRSSCFLESSITVRRDKVDTASFGSQTDNVEEPCSLWVSMTMFGALQQQLKDEKNTNNQLLAVNHALQEELLWECEAHAGERAEQRATSAAEVQQLRAGMQQVADDLKGEIVAQRKLTASAEGEMTMQRGALQQVYGQAADLAEEVYRLKQLGNSLAAVREREGQAMLVREAAHVAKVQQLEACLQSASFGCAAAEAAFREACGRDCVPRGVRSPGSV